MTFQLAPLPPRRASRGPQHDVLACSIASGSEPHAFLMAALSICGGICCAFCGSRRRHGTSMTSEIATGVVQLSTVPLCRRNTDNAPLGVTARHRCLGGTCVPSPLLGCTLWCVHRSSGCLLIDGPHTWRDHQCGEANVCFLIVVKTGLHTTRHHRSGSSSSS